MKLLLHCSGVCLALFAALHSDGAPSPLAGDQLEFFERKIRPVLVAECYECHTSEKHKGGLALDHRDGLLKGGETGPAIVPGDPEKSLLILSITHRHEEFKMPKKAPKLDERTIANFVAWVKMGAPDPRDQPAAAASEAGSWPALLASRREWWSLEPVQKPALPPVRDSAWSAHPVDQFILARLDAAHLTPADSAERYTLIRRLTFALTGLPPTPADVTAFLADNSPGAYEKVVDRLLASARFGERWARHWMDLMRYAETHGSEGDPEIRMAWRYRDYLIRAFNDDVPCDRLVAEHIAGDLLAPRLNDGGDFNESVLGIANLRLVEHGFQPVDTLDDQVNVVENQIDVLSKAFQGLTISCARCHDHKFDAISQRDFYALFGVFASCRPAQVTIDTPGRLTTSWEQMQVLKGRIKSALADAWLEAAAEIGGRLKQEPGRGSGTDELTARQRELERKIADIDWQARRAALESNGPQHLSAPIAIWTFDGDARDMLGGLHGSLEGGAQVRNGRLILDGKGAFVKTGAIPRALREKTFEAWVSVGSLKQRGGGVITLETTRPGRRSEDLRKAKVVADERGHYAILPPEKERPRSRVIILRLAAESEGLSLAIAGNFRTLGRKHDGFIAPDPIGSSVDYAAHYKNAPLTRKPREEMLGFSRRALCNC